MIYYVSKLCSVSFIQRSTQARFYNDTLDLTLSRSKKYAVALVISRVMSNAYTS